MIRNTAVIILAFLLTGCATSATSTHSYFESKAIKIENEITVKREFEDVWSNLVKQLAKSFFVVNNIEKESRLINVSFSTESPENYINCGTSSRTFKYGNEVNTINYEVAADSEYKYGHGTSTNGQATIISDVYRKTDLEGRINIYVAPDKNSSIISVNTRYIFNIEISGTTKALNMYGQSVQAKPIATKHFTMTFSTNQKGVITKSGKDKTVCYSNGVLENKILSMVNKK